MNPMRALRETYTLWDMLASLSLERIESILQTVPSLKINKTDSLFLKETAISMLGTDFLHLLDYKALCPLCHYTIGGRNKINCEKCLVWFDDSRCYEKPQEYFYWLYNGFKPEYAKAVADAARENYDLLKALGYSELDDFC